MGITMKRNYIIDDIKVVFAIAIACSHYMGSVLSAGIVVECFFIVSGYFLMATYESNKFTNAYSYTKNRIKKIYPQYITAFVILFIWKNHKLLGNGIGWFKQLAKSLPEIFLLQNTGIFSGGINYPLWQLCVLIIASHILYSLLLKNKECTLNVICPILIFCVYTYMANIFGKYEVDVFNIEYHFLYIPIYRALASVSLGMILYKPVNEAADYINRKLYGWQISILSLMAMGTFWINRYTYVAIISFSLILIFCFVPNGFLSKLNQKPIISGEVLSLWIYLNHAFIIDILNTYNIRLIGNESGWGHKVCFVFILIIYSILTNQLVEWIKKLWEKYKPIIIRDNV